MSSTTNTHDINKHFPKKKKSKRNADVPRDINSMPENLRCPCGGGQSCLIDRRWLGDWVHEDIIFNDKGINLRKSCMVPYTDEQNAALVVSMK